MKSFTHCCPILINMRAKFIVCFCVVVLAALIEAKSRSSPPKDDFESYKKHHSKAYRHEQHEKRAMEHFNRNRESVKQHNEKHKNGEVKYTMGLNKFADLPQSVLDGMNGGKVPTAWLQKMQKLNRRRRGKTVALAGFDDLPAPPKAFDWRNKDGTNYVTPSKNQGTCGDCYSFASVGALESQILINGLAQKDLSEEQVADCFETDPDPELQANEYYDTNGCNGGFPVDVFKYLEDIGGITTEDVYPYTLGNSKVSKPCSFDPRTAVQKILTHGSVHAPDDQTLKKLLVNKGSLVVLINADHLHLYDQGIFHSKKTKVNHAVLLIGYGNDDDGKGDYWIIKNSWGADAGEGDGAFRLSMDRSENAGLTGNNSAIAWVEIDNA